MHISYPWYFVFHLSILHVKNVRFYAKNVVFRSSSILFRVGWLWNRDCCRFDTSGVGLSSHSLGRPAPETFMHIFPWIKWNVKKNWCKNQLRQCCYCSNTAVGGEFFILYCALPKDSPEKTSQAWIVLELRKKMSSGFIKLMKKQQRLSNLTLRISTEKWKEKFFFTF